MTSNWFPRFVSVLPFARITTYSNPTISFVNQFLEMFWNRNTKFHQIILIGIFSILIGSSEPFRKLSPDENQDRLKTCGKFQLQKFPDNRFNKDNQIIFNDTSLFDTSVLDKLVTFTGQLKDGVAFYATATAISPHHVLTSSYVVLDEQKNWRYIPQPAKCTGSADIEVPSEVLKAFTDLPLAGATILSVCNSSNQLVEDFTRKLMLAEIKDGNFKNYFCLKNETTSQEGDVLSSYGRAWDPDYYKLYLRKLQFVRFIYDKIVTEQYEAKDGFASALVKEETGKNILLGIDMGAKGQTIGQGNGIFYNIVDYQDKICKLAGICEVSIITTTTSTTPPTTSTTTQAPTTPSTSSEKPNITISTTSSTNPHPKPSPTSIPSKAPEDSEPQENSNRRLEMDVDEEYEEYLARKKESEKDYEDVDDDIVVSRDFFAKAGKRELSVFVLVLIIVMGVVQ
ncbi:hypothetical protein B9Z55_003019 [Caenorhabditis nigoni]|uniref:Uncharacterized protein n=1 Tax=Caenorhabditis nigoni TaxID=1611254 RepID=A0A2G5VN76_9PELO|nr:hypothetical protein B9Z55_003019 [Caenorhabditis nigoni]